MNYQNVQVTLLQVCNSKQKCTKIIELAKQHFEKREPLLIRLPNEKALEYVDLLLWRSPQDSFLPHAVADEYCEDLIVLTTSEKNFNKARSVLNLSPEPVTMKSTSPFVHIYEFENLSDNKIDKFSKERYKSYKEQGFRVSLSR